MRLQRRQRDVEHRVVEPDDEQAEGRGRRASSSGARTPSGRSFRGCMGAPRSRLVRGSGRRARGSRRCGGRRRAAAARARPAGRRPRRATRGRGRRRGRWRPRAAAQRAVEALPGRERRRALGGRRGGGGAGTSGMAAACWRSACRTSGTPRNPDPEPLVEQRLVDPSAVRAGYAGRRWRCAPRIRSGEGLSSNGSGRRSTISTAGRRVRRGRGRAGDRQDVAAGRAAAARRGARVIWCSRDRPRSSSATCRSASGSTRSTPTSRRRSSRARRRRRRVAGRSLRRAALAATRRSRERAGAGRRAPPGASRDPRAAGCDRGAQAARARARRPALERRRVDRGARRAAAPAAPRARVLLALGYRSGQGAARSSLRRSRRPR